MTLFNASLHSYACFEDGIMEIGWLGFKLKSLKSPTLNAVIFLMAYALSRVRRTRVISELHFACQDMRPEKGKAQMQSCLTFDVVN